MRVGLASHKLAPASNAVARAASLQPHSALSGMFSHLMDVSLLSAFRSFRAAGSSQTPASRSRCCLSNFADSLSIFVIEFVSIMVCLNEYPRWYYCPRCRMRVNEVYQNPLIA